ncbi:MAG TPA: hypothetical protein VF041_17335 [Gemmatimonadaceae bacterium]
MRYPVDYVRHAAREVRKIEARLRLGEGDDGEPVSRAELMELLKTVWKALDEVGDAIEGLQRARD